jgi:hypothetical protein
MRVLLTCLLIYLGAGQARASKGATGQVADLDAEAKAFSDSAPERSLAVAKRAQASARPAGDVRGEAEALNE